jgi:hypothetical protein
MSALSDLRRLLAGPSSQDVSGTVIELYSNGRILVRTARRVITCTSLVPVAAGDPVRVQGSLIVSRQLAPTGSLPEYRV